MKIGTRYLGYNRVGLRFGKPIANAGMAVGAAVVVGLAFECSSFLLPSFQFTQQNRPAMPFSPHSHSSSLPFLPLFLCQQRAHESSRRGRGGEEKSDSAGFGVWEVG